MRDLVGAHSEHAAEWHEHRLAVAPDITYLAAEERIHRTDNGGLALGGRRAAETKPHIRGEKAREFTLRPASMLSKSALRHCSRLITTDSRLNGWSEDILGPSTMMPPYQGKLTRAQLDGVIAYIKAQGKP